ncbi:hypothetical protein TRFO_39385 [Tritrichomonas foetus]|uniref:Uncharacterized protein n=1 Tax=Tritrichomonas foetus TaxID=1144522 RepID=A0A1J4J575_9EUKA|nr:hypothetical protein TRFO_39385 [Tritrichomonas foetus]|eukprot:OHS94418.1 hypothetical protein TRFO_39385 [Tritrichomonas foetus]
MDTFGNVIISMKLINPPKTHDPLYQTAKENLKLYHVECKKISNLLVEFSRQMEMITNDYVRLLTGFKDWSEGTSTDTICFLDQTINNAKMSQTIVIESLLSKLEPNVINYLNSFEAHVREIYDVQKERKAALKIYDKYREKIKLIEKEKNKRQEKLDRAHEKFDIAKKKYEPLNQKFSDLVNKLGDIRTTTLMIPFKNFPAIISQFLLKINHSSDDIPFSIQNTNTNIFPDQLDLPKTTPSPQDTTKKTQQNNDMFYLFDNQPPNKPEVNSTSTINKTSNVPNNQMNNRLNPASFSYDNSSDDGWSSAYNPFEQGQLDSFSDLVDQTIKPNPQSTKQGKTKT